jgi:hypothetical protein
MFLRANIRKKDGKEHSYWSVVENKRLHSGKIVQRHVLYLGELNGVQETAWRKSVVALFEDDPVPRQVALFPEERAVEAQCDGIPAVRVRCCQMRLERPRQWGACWLGCELWGQLGLDSFWQERLLPSRKGTRWDLILQTLVLYRLIAPGAEWRLHREWFGRSAVGDLLGSDFSLAEIHRLYACHDLLLEHKDALFGHLRQRWVDLFAASFEVLLYDLTSTYFECEAQPHLEDKDDKRRFGYSRDKRPDCLQVVIALIITPEGFPLAYEVLPGNTSDKTTLESFLSHVESRYGKARRIWIMDRGIPTEEVLEKMRANDPVVSYLVGTPKGRLSKLEAALLKEPWKEVRGGVKVKLLPQDGEVYVQARSLDRVAKERAMRKRSLKALWKRLGELQKMELTRDELLLKLGAVQKQYPGAWRLADITLPEQGAQKTQGSKLSKAKGKTKLKKSEPTPQVLPPVDTQETPPKAQGSLQWSYRLKRDKLAMVRRREGNYLLRSNLTGENPAQLWEHYMQLVQIEQAFKEIKHDLSIRPVHHQHLERIEAHIFISFLSYCLQVTLKARLSSLAGGLTPRSVLEKFAGMQMVDVHMPTTDGREVILSRYTQPDKDLELLLTQMKLQLPQQPPPRITAAPQGTL